MCMYIVVEWSCIGYMQCTVCRACLEIGCTVHSEKQPLSTQKTVMVPRNSMVSWDTLYFQTKPYINNIHYIIVPCLYPSYVYIYTYIYIHCILYTLLYKQNTLLYTLVIVYPNGNPYSYGISILNSHSKKSTDVQPKKKRRLPRHFGHFLLVHRLIAMDQDHSG